MTERSHGITIERVSVIVGCLMIIAATGFMASSALLPPPGPHSVAGKRWVLQHWLTAGLLQLLLGTLLVVAARATRLGRAWGRSTLRVVIAIVLVSFAAFSVI